MAVWSIATGSSRPHLGRSVFTLGCHFERFNDTHGHAAGDAVLREVAATLAARCRGSDVVCRYGGEEFVVLFPRCDLEDAVHRAEALRLAVREMKVQCEGRPLPQVPSSVGVAASPDQGLGPVVN